jgi:Alpha/beta hydrolase domain
MNFDRRTILMAGGSSLLMLATRARPASIAASAHLEGPLTDPSKGLLLWGVDANGYVAEEFFLRGVADTYESVSMADAVDTNTRDNVADQARRTFPLKRTAAARPYCTRLVVYRPAQAARFSGTVLMEPTHPIAGGTNIVWRNINSFFMERGDAYIAVQHPATLPGLAQADAARYGALNAVHATQLWGMLADAGRLVKGAPGPGASATRLLGGVRPRRLYMTGYSFTGVATATFADYHHDKTRLPGGAPVFDGYMPMANAMYVKPLDVPVMRINTQSDFDSFGGLKNRAPDSDHFRHYEVAGAAHVWSERPQTGEAVPPHGPAIAPPPGQPHLDPATCYAQFPQGSKPNDFPLNLVMTQAFLNLYDWVEKGTAPPPSTHIEVDAQGQTRLDDNGNALGGLRLPEVSVPSATYGVAHGTLCFLFGYRLNFDGAKLKQLYGTKDSYVAKVTEAAQQLVAQRLIQPKGAVELSRVAGLIDPF